MADYVVQQSYIHTYGTHLGKDGSGVSGWFRNRFFLFSVPSTWLLWHPSRTSIPLLVLLSHMFYMLKISSYSYFFLTKFLPHSFFFLLNLSSGVVMQNEWDAYCVTRSQTPCWSHPCRAATEIKPVPLKPVRHFAQNALFRMSTIPLWQLSPATTPVPIGFSSHCFRCFSCRIHPANCPS